MPNSIDVLIKAIDLPEVRAALTEAYELGATQERERLRDAALYPYPTRDADGKQRGQCQICGEDGVSEDEIAAFFTDPEPTVTTRPRTLHDEEDSDGRE